MSTILGFDYGTKRIGLAVGQTVTCTANPLAQLQNYNTPDWDTLDKIIEEWQPSQLVVGLPLNMDDSKSTLSEKARQFAEQLEQRYKLPTHLIDERLSSREAKERLYEQGQHRPSKEAINSIAAQVILENWLNLESS